MIRLDLWQQFEYTAMKPGLERIEKFLNLTGNPQRSFKIVHIAGTNGKGSTARMISSILEAAGYRTGLYVSPHLKALNERIQVNSKAISLKMLNALAGKYSKSAKKCSLTFFEFITALAYVYFRSKRIDVAVLETGLGGRFDATNVVERPAVSIITDIDLDHTAVLGRTIAAIAKEKAGIIKKGCPVISGAENKAAVRVIKKAAEEHGSEYFQLGLDFKSESTATRWKRAEQRVNYSDRSQEITFTVPLLGEYQAKNSGIAVAAVRALNRQGFKVSRKAVTQGLEAVSWPGRFDVRRAAIRGVKKTIILDGAHNPGAMRRFLSAFKKSPWVKKPFRVIMGVLKDKDFKKIAKEITRLGAEVTTVPVRSIRTAGHNDLGRAFRSLRFKKFSSAEDLKSALKAKEETIIITGSLYLIGEALRMDGIKQAAHK